MTSGLVLKVTGSGSAPDSSNRRLIPWDIVHHVSEVPTPEPGNAKSVLWFRQAAGAPSDVLLTGVAPSPDGGLHLPIKESLEELEMQLRNQRMQR